MTHSSRESIGDVNCGISAFFWRNIGKVLTESLVECPSRSKLRMWFTVGLKISTDILENAIALPQGVGITSRTLCSYQLPSLPAAYILCFSYQMSTRSLACKYFRWECFIQREALLSLSALFIIPVGHANSRAVFSLYLNFNDDSILENDSCILSRKSMILDL